MTIVRTAEDDAAKRSNGKRVRVYGGLAILALVCVAALQLRPRPASSQGATPHAASPARGLSSLVPSAADTGAGADDAASKAADFAPSGGGPIALIGLVQADQATLSVVQPARIVGVAVSEGDHVRRGEALVRLDAAAGRAQERTAAAGVAGARAQLAKARVGLAAQRVKADADVATARAGLQQAQDKLQQAVLGRQAAQAEQQADLDAARQNVRKAQLGLESARRTLNSLEQLNTVGGVARNDLEGARTQAATAQSDLEQAEAQVRRLQAGPPGGAAFRVELAGRDVAAAQAGVKQAREGVATALQARTETLRLAQSDIQAAQAGVAQAEAGLSGAQSAAQFATLTSPLDGVVAGVGAHTGEIAQPGATLVTVVAQSGYRIEALVTARQLPRLHVGQPAKVALDTRPGQTWTASLYAISSVAEPDGRTFRIKLRFEHLPADLRSNQSVRLIFVTK
jgi:multidrug resistance efflux pump